jgi:urease accessory protein
MRALNRLGLSALCIGLVPAIAHAHPGHTGHDFGAGLAHPIAGLDHVLVMLAVGIWAARLGGRARWIVPASFLSLMVVGGMLPSFDIALPMAESTILASVLIMGIILMLALKVPTAIGAAVVGLFALAHGYAHGAEMPSDATMSSFAAGFVLATATLHFIGVGIGELMRATRRDSWVRFCGSAITAAGLLLAIGAL